MSQEHTPLMQQYHDLKKDYQDTLLFFQVGDFFELFYEDAQKASSFLGIALTARGKNKGEPIPLCGVPVHAKDHYVAKLIKGGFNVALCEQLESPTPGKVVKRGITQVFTPSTLTDATLLEDKKASYLFSFFPLQNTYGLLFGELLTAQLFATTVPEHADRSIESELSRFFPDEIVLPQTPLGKQFAAKFRQLGYCTTFLDMSVESMQEADTWINQQFGEDITTTLDQHEALRCAVRYFYAYINRNQKSALAHFNQFHLYTPDEFLLLDAATQRNLELIKNNQDGSIRHTLFSVLDRAQTPMGSRLIRKWLVRPLLKQQAIMQRQEVIEHCIRSFYTAQTLREHIAQIGDLERIVGRIALDRATLHDFLGLKRALHILTALLEDIKPFNGLILMHVIEQRCYGFDTLATLLHTAFNDDVNKEWIIKEGFDAQLDHLRDLVNNSNQKLLNFELQEQRATGIASLKVRYTNIYGYYIEITNTHAHRVPEHYMRRQTLVGKERFITHELQRLAHDIETAAREIQEREQYVFTQVKKTVMAETHKLRKLAYALCNLDALLALAECARHGNYVKPTFNNDRTILIHDGRHPVIEQVMQQQFIPNDVRLSDEQTIWIITGPNMGGKSTYLRQNALMCIMAQIGSFVPARSASLPLLDRIFTRIGAGDNLAEGKSTFLVEMEETATICIEATRNSLVILDEVGRGTSTFDGLALAQAIVEYIYNRIGARCLFATHYHELTHLQNHYAGIVSYHAASKKTEAGIVFLYKILCGAADGSFGIEVGKLAGLPQEIIQRAHHVVQTLQNNSPSILSTSDNVLMTENEMLRQIVAQMQSEQKNTQNNAIIKKYVQEIDFDDLSPKKAFDILWHLKELL